MSLLRIMSLLNLSLQGLAVERSALSPEDEILMKAEFREIAAKKPHLKAAYVKSMKACIEL